MMHVIRVAALLATATASIFARSVGPEVYRNEEFGITAPVPEGALLCPTPQNEHDHGPLFLLGTRDSKRCQDVERQRAIDVFASYNAIQATKTLDKFLRSECRNTFKAECRPAPSGLQVNGLPSKAARVSCPDGWIDIFVVTQAGKPAPDFDASVPSVNYDLSLHTTPGHLKEDLPIFRAVLATIQLSPE
ncbi:MAG TPA: hypothetical protein VFB10_13035 [Candidatus Dormibacteraeota bacterium]|nr:hypothetical protein [Candidatus Dormibacteraeota bacterium]